LKLVIFDAVHDSISSLANAVESHLVEAG